MNRFSRLIYFITTVFGTLWLNYDYTRNNTNQIIFDVIILGLCFYALVVRKSNKN